MRRPRVLLAFPTYMGWSTHAHRLLRIGRERADIECSDLGLAASSGLLVVLQSLESNPFVGRRFATIRG